MTAYRYTRVNAFTEEPLTGNPLVVFTNATGLDGKMMQILAREMNLSESSFVLRAEQGGTAKVRIFTPTAELPFAGHPVLGTAFVLAAPLQANTVTLKTEGERTRSHRTRRRSASDGMDAGPLANLGRGL